MSTIATKIHALDELIPGSPLIQQMREAHSYVIDNDVVELLKRDDAKASIMAMVEAGVARLPLNPLVVEYKIDVTSAFHWAVLLRETSNVGGSIEARVACLVKQECALMHDAPMTLGIERDGVTCTGHNDPMYAASAILAIGFALLMLNVRGLSKRVIETEKLNRVRVKRGRTSVPTHSVVHIASVYDRNGNVAGDGESVRHRRMRVHLRRGHVRQQAHGPEFQDRKLIYIPPVLVNFRDADGGVIHPVRQVIKA